MDWFKTKGAQLIAFAGIVSTLAGFVYTGAEYVNRITNLEKKISRVEGTEDAQQEIEERFSAIETSVSYINKSIDDSIMPEIKENSNMIKVIDVDISTATTKIDALDNRVKRIEDQDDNPFQKFIFVAQAIDAWRIIPRAFLAVYMYLLYFTTFWFMDLPEPSFEQSGLISIVVGAGAAWFGLYTNSSKPKA